MQAEANRYAITKLKDCIHENNVLFVEVLTIIFTIAVIANLQFLCYYFKCYSTIYFKILSFYQRTLKPKRNIKTNDIVLFTNLFELKKPHASLVLSADIETIEPDLDERHEARNSRNEASFISRLKSTL